MGIISRSMGKDRPTRAKITTTGLFIESIDR